MERVLPVAVALALAASAQAWPFGPKGEALHSKNIVSMKGSNKPPASTALAFGLHSSAFPLIGMALALCVLVLPTQADVLIGTNGDRFTGKVIQETADSVVFDSELGGKVTIARSRIREIQRSPPQSTEHALAATNGTSAGSRAALTNRPSTLSPEDSGLKLQLATNAWLPPELGQDNLDWIQLKSGSWLRGRFKYLQQRHVEFDNDELDEQTFRLKEVRQIRPAGPAWVRLDNRDQPVFGTVVLSNGVVSVSGAEELSASRDRLLGITPAGGRGIRAWSGHLSVGLSLQSGNNDMITLTTSAELARRTPVTDLVLDYLGNYGEANGVQNANNQRVSLAYDVRLDRHWFVRPAFLEYYHDPVANISVRGTAMTGVGYYIFDQSGLSWNVAAGPGVEYTRFEEVEPGQADSVTAPAAVLQTKFKVDLTGRLTFSEKLQSVFTSEEAGQYTHHAVTSLEFKIKRHLDLDVSFVWDYLHNPKMESSGEMPQKSDFYLTVGLGARF